MPSAMWSRMESQAMSNQTHILALRAQARLQRSRMWHRESAHAGPLSPYQSYKCLRCADSVHTAL